MAIHRIEQLYPIRAESLYELLEPYAPGTQVIWAQEEPKNMGAWPHLILRFGQSINDGMYPLDVVSRPSSASPATGSAASHKIEQALVIDQALEIPATRSAKKRRAKGDK